jgi:hypothetical protein
VSRLLGEGQSVPQLVEFNFAALTPSGDSVVLHVPSGTYLTVDSTARAILNLLGKHKDVSRAAAALAQQYSIPLDRAEADVESVLETLGRLRASRGSVARRPTLSGIRQISRQWASVPASAKYSIVKALGIVVVVEVALRTMNVMRVADLMKVPLTSNLSEPFVEDSCGDTGLSPKEERLHWAVRWVLARWIFDGTCLRYALATGFFLRKQAPVLRLGLIGDGSTTHAWVEAGGRAYNAVPVTGTFRPASCDPN